MNESKYRPIKRLLGYAILISAACIWLVGMIKLSGSALSVPSMLIALLIVALFVGGFVGVIKLICWCFDL